MRKNADTPAFNEQVRLVDPNRDITTTLLNDYK